MKGRTPCAPSFFMYNSGMSTFISPEDSVLVERAIRFLVVKYQESGHNPKPVVLHSIRVGMLLLELGYDAKTVATGVLHDLVEDTDVTLDDIAREFGAEIAAWVGAVSFKSEIKNPVEQYKEMYARTLAAGKPAATVKAADLHMNSLYIRLVPDLEQQHMLIEKIEYFLGATAAYRDEPVFREAEKTARRGIRTV